LEFVVLLVRKLQQDRVCTLYDAASEAYSACLQPYHGFIASAAFTVRSAFPKYHTSSTQSSREGTTVSPLLGFVSLTATLNKLRAKWSMPRILSAI
jgi:hypothetical protein